MTIDLTALGWDAERTAYAARRGEHQPGRVARVDRGSARCSPQSARSGPAWVGRC